MEDILKEYSNTANPLFERFKDRAPGSAKHSVNVAELCESVATELGLDPLLARVCGLYHDIGKMVHPLNFTENQDDENIHDKLEPFISYHLITRHVSDTALILTNQTSLPKEVIDIVTRHHGSSVLASIYSKAKKEDIDRYRYPSAKPNCAYSSVLMICDVVEAFARSEFTAGKLDTAKKRATVIDKGIERLVADEQLDEMKIGMLRVVKDKLLRELDSMFHSRVQYDDDEEEEDK